MSQVPIYSGLHVLTAEGLAQVRSVIGPDDSGRFAVELEPSATGFTRHVGLHELAPAHARSGVGPPQVTSTGTLLLGTGRPYVVIQPDALGIGIELVTSESTFTFHRPPDLVSALDWSHRALAIVEWHQSHTWVVVARVSAG